MRVKRLRLKNGYKRFHDLTIDLGDDPARIVALIGPNGCGKSSVLDGLILFHRNYGSIGNTGARDDSYYAMDTSVRFDYSQSIELQFKEGGYNDVRSLLNEKNRGKTLFSIRSPYRYNSNVKIESITSTTDIRLNDYGAGDASSLDPKMESNYRRLLGKLNRYMVENDAKPSEAKAAIVADLNLAITKCLNLEIASLGNVEDGKGTIYIKKPDHSREFEFNFLSAGEKEVIDILLDLYLRRDDYNQSVFLIDEPELHVNTAIQSSLITEIDRMVGDQCQIWLTTHSIGFIRALQTTLKDKCQIIYFDGQNDFARRPFRLVPMKSSAAAWRELFTIALNDLAALVSPQVIVYCEGRDAPGVGGAERGLDAKAFNSIFSETNPDVLFVSSGGNTELDQRSAIALSILTKVFPTLEIIVLKDRDVGSGTFMDETQRSVYLENNPKNHRMLKRLEIENYLYDKEVLKAYCHAKSLSFDEAAYDTLVTDIVNQNLKDQTGRIKRICGIVGSISKDQFKLTLSEYLSPDMKVFQELRDCVLPYS